MLAHNLQLSIVASLFCVAILSVTSCRGSDDDSPLAWKQVQTVLENKEIGTISDVFKRFSELPIGKGHKEFYSDSKARVADFATLDKYLADYYQLDHLDRAEMRKRLAKRVTWQT